MERQESQAPNHDLPTNPKRYPDWDIDDLQGKVYYYIAYLNDQGFYELISSLPRHLLEAALTDYMSAPRLYKFIQEIKAKKEEAKSR